ncbi:3-oxoacyl-[acyl-carrier-protein] reductase FabG-like [Clavelina lepadiformis]|uniref:3-oxoacyl-[acyl-carrier-protein] reductase FabG-like n=1 Tax=Clavelina lepadiformis TaxID=159417 RepID=UPI0040437CB5
MRSLRAGDMTEFASKVVLVSGAASGIGQAIANAFAKKGASLSLVDKDEENLNKVTEQCKKAGARKVLAVVADLQVEDNIVRAMNETIKTFDRLDVLVNNAGVFRMGSVAEAPMESFDLLFHVNVKAHFHFTQLAVPHLEKTKGNVINMTSVAGEMLIPGGILYGMTNAAMIYFTKSAALGLAGKEIRVNAVSPGLCKTNIMGAPGALRLDVNEASFYGFEAKTHPLGGVLVEKEDVANAILFLASNSARAITGTCLAVDRGRLLAGSANNF